MEYNWITKAGVSGASVFDKSPVQTTALSFNAQDLLAVGDNQGRLVLFKASGSLQFEGEVQAFDYDFNSVKSYEVPQSIVAIEWTSATQLVAANDKEIKFYKLRKLYSKPEATSKQKLQETGEALFPSGESAQQKQGRGMELSLQVSNLH